jgi:hypothetical protein
MHVTQRLSFGGAFDESSRRQFLGDNARGRYGIYS